MDYPAWQYFPVDSPAPQWAQEFVAVVAAQKATIDSNIIDGVTSDTALAHLRPGLEELGYEVESGKAKAQKIYRPVLFGPQGAARVTYEVDAVHDDLGVVVEIEAGRGAMSNAIYRDLIRASLIVGARYLVLGVLHEYRFNSGNKVVRSKSFADTQSQLEAIYASGRLGLPFEGILLIGY